jgi:hypothetical protein
MRNELEQEFDRGESVYTFRRLMVLSERYSRFEIGILACFQWSVKEESILQKRFNIPLEIVRSCRTCHPARRLAWVQTKRVNRPSGAGCRTIVSWFMAQTF